MTFASGIVPVHVASGDLDQDGDLDLVVVGGACTLTTGGNAYARIYLNTSDWSPISDGLSHCESCTILLSECGVPDEVLIAPLNGDIYPDIALTVNNSGQGAVVILTNSTITPGEAFDQDAYSVDSGYMAYGIAAATFDTDGDLDLAVSGGVDPNATGAVFLFENDASAGFDLHSTIALSAIGEGTDLVLGKFDLDDFNPDIVVSHNNGSSISVVPRSGEFAFDDPETLAGPTEGP